MHTMRIGVLMGGKSVEHEVSFNSGRTVCDHLDTTQYHVVPLFQTVTGKLYILPYRFLHRGKTTDFIERLASEAQEVIWDDLPQKIDFMYIATHGRYAEDGTLQGMLEVLNIPYLGSGIYASALSMDKAKQKDVLRAAGIAVPQSITVSVDHIHTFDTAKIMIADALQKNNLSFPLVVKPVHEGSSLGVTVVADASGLQSALLHACHIDAHGAQPVIIEECMSGMEFSCIVLTDNNTGELFALPPTEIVIEAGTTLYDYEQKYMPGRAEKHTPPRCLTETTRAIQQTCVETMKALDICTIGRIDGFVTRDNRVVIIDPNTLSGMGPTSFLFREAAEINMSHTDLINHLLKTDLINYGMVQSMNSEHTHEALGAHTKKIRIAVLMGGNSAEREISLESGRNVVYKLSPHTYEVLPIFVTESMGLYHINQSLLVRSSTHEIASLVDTTMQIRWHDLSALVDFVFIGLHGGSGENGAVQGALEMLGIPYNGSGVLASSLCMDKHKTAKLLAEHGIAVPQEYLITESAWKKDRDEECLILQEKLSLPYIVKPHDDGCSVLISKVKTMDEAVVAIEHMFAQKRTAALLQECIVGTELTVGVLGNTHPYALPASEVVVSGEILSIEEKFLPGAGENQTPARLSEKIIADIQHTVVAAFKATGCTGYARVDCFYQTAEQSPTGKERTIILEINTLPGLTPATCIFHQAAEIGMKPMDFIDTIVTLGFEHHASKKVHMQKQKDASVQV